MVRRSRSPTSSANTPLDRMVSGMAVGLGTGVENKAVKAMNEVKAIRREESRVDVGIRIDCDTIRRYLTFRARHHKVSGRSKEE